MPPAASIFFFAPAEKWSALTVSFLVSSPLPRTRRPSKVPMTSRLALRAARSTVALASNFSRSPTLTTAYTLAQVALEKPRFGKRR